MKYEDVSEGLRVVTTQSLYIRRNRGGDIEEDLLPSGSECTVAFEDNPGDFLLVDVDNEEVWNVQPEAFEPAP